MQTDVPTTRRRLRRLVAASMGSLVAAGVLHAAPANPFQVIADANAFRLRAPVPLRIEPPPQQPKPQVSAKLTGVTSMFGDKTPRAFLEIQEAGKPALKRAVLRAGEQSDGVEVVAIDVLLGTTTIRIGGEESVLTLARSESNPVKPPILAISTINPRH